MIFYPAIDIKDGKCIRLEKGLLKNIKFYNENPVDQAKQFENDGCCWIHVVDIDGAFNGKPCNHEIIFKIKKNTKCKIQVGGGIRSIETIEKFLLNSIDRVILGTVALKDPNFVIEACKKFPGKIAVGIDSRNNKVSINGWSKSSNVSTEELVNKFEGAGVSAIIFTDINKDGLLKGMNFHQIKRLLKYTNIKIIASGGVSNIDDLKELKRINNNNLEGVISGKALYEGKILVSDAIKILS